MKTVNRLFGILLGTTALLFSCTKQENPVRQDGNTFEMTIVAGSDQTRTVLGSDGTVTWSATGEQLAVMEVANGTETKTSKAASKEGVRTDEGATMSFGVSMNAKTADSFDYYALYPNSACVSNNNTNVEKFKVELVSTQTPTESSFGPSADVLVAKPVTGLTSQPKELNLQFARVISVGKMTIKNLNTKENVKKVTFTAVGKAVTGRSYIDFTTAEGVEYGYSDQGVDNVILDYSDKTIVANGMTAYFTCWPFKLAAGEKFSVVVETENYTFTKDITLAEGKSLAFNVGRASAFNVNFDGIEGIKKVQLVKDGAYVVAYGENMMAVGTSSNKYRDVATLPTANEDGSYSVDATAAWNFVYDSATDTYKICGLDVSVFEEPMLISPEMMNLLDVMTEEKIQVDVADDVLVFTTPDCVVYGHKMEGIEDYQVDAITQLLTEDFDSFCKVSKTDLLAALDRIALFVDQYDNKAITLTFTKDGLNISSKQSSGVEVLPYIASDKFKAYTCKIDIVMLTTQVKALVTDAVTIHYGNERSIKMTEGNITQVIALLEE